MILSGTLSRDLEVADVLDSDGEVEVTVRHEGNPEATAFLDLDQATRLRDHLTALLGDAPVDVVEEAPAPVVEYRLLPVVDLPAHYVAQVLDFVYQRITRHEVAPLGAPTVGPVDGTPG